jgi:hypothetical protein
VIHLLQAIALASLLCMAVRSLMVTDMVGILVWPVLLGFGTDRLVGGGGLWGGTIGGLVAFAVADFAFAGPASVPGAWTDPWILVVSVFALGSGICWGFYLSVWVYLIVETVLQYR